MGDTDVAEEYFATMRAMFSGGLDYKPPPFQTTLTFHGWYIEYLKSDKWKKTRELILSRDVVCQGCYTKNRPYHVHHLTYEHVGNEFLFELITLCEKCHTRVHDKSSKLEKKPWQ